MAVHIFIGLLLAAGNQDDVSLERVERLTVTVEGVEREALVVNGRKADSGEKRPLIFAFHGHGGSARQAMRSFGLHRLWAQATVIYLQGLPGVPGITDQGGTKAGWQKNPGELKDRDVKFFDAALEQVKLKFAVNSEQIYAMGHSNGSRFVCVLQKMRGKTFRAVATSGGQGGLLWRGIDPIPILIMGGEKDTLVPIGGQRMSIGLLEKTYQIDESKTKTVGEITTKSGKNGVVMETYLHDGGHGWTREMSQNVVRFFKQQRRQ